MASRQLDGFTMQNQNQINWCWAATAASVDAYFRKNVGAMSQCNIAGLELSRTDCCGGGAAGPCNVYGLLSSALALGNDHLEYWAFSKTATLAQIQAEIDGERPICFRVRWTGGGAHFVAVSGYATVGVSEFLVVEDSSWGISQRTYDDLMTSYRQMGVCTDTFYTKSA